jgi:UDP-glucuronate 4-epimerase
MQTLLVTGAAGFIGSSVIKTLFLRNSNVDILGIDSLNSYYDPQLKQDRLKQLSTVKGFRFEQCDLADKDKILKLVKDYQPDVILHLAAQAGVRYSLDNPFAYADSNLTGHLAVLEACRHAGKTPRLVYASSSSVYGGNTKIPFSEDDPVTQPRSLYAATKRSDELMSATYAHLYDIRSIGLRFFTVYGEWGRPDMAYWSFSEKLLTGGIIKLFNHGNLRRDFTYIDDIVAGTLACCENVSSQLAEKEHRIYNLGNNTPVGLRDFVAILEQETGVEAKMDLVDMQPGDVYETYADISKAQADFGYAPSTSLEAGLKKFVAWFRDYKGL